MPEDTTISKCIVCGGEGFMDLPAGSHAERWKGTPDRPMCACLECGVWFPQESVAEECRVPYGKGAAE